MANDKWISDKKMKELIERDTAMPLHKFYFAPGLDPLPSCPSCREILISRTDNFCRKCGQRLDCDNWEL